MHSDDLRWVLGRARRYLEKTERRLDSDAVLSEFGLRLARRACQGRLPADGRSYWDGLGFSELKWSILEVLRHSQTAVVTAPLDGVDVPEPEADREGYYDDWADQLDRVLSRVKLTAKQSAAIYRRRYGISQPPAENARAAQVLHKLTQRVSNGN